MKAKYRHELMDGWDKDKVGNTTVLIGGIGATGSHAAVTLARIGIGKIIVIDNDVLEEHNIGNQVYLRAQVGSSKVDALKEIINEINSTRVVGIKGKVQNVDFDRLRLSEDEPTSPDDPEEELLYRIFGDEFTSAVDGLPVEFRLVILLSDVEGFSYKEIAEIVDCPIGTVMSRLHRGRKLLRSSLREYAEELGYACST